MLQTIKHCIIVKIFCTYLYMDIFIAKEYKLFMEIHRIPNLEEGGAQGQNTKTHFHLNFRTGGQISHKLGRYHS